LINKLKELEVMAPYDDNFSEEKSVIIVAQSTKEIEKVFGY